MKLYVYDHCPFCTKARMIFGLKSLPLELEYLLENDVATPTKLVGKKATPILQKEDGSYMAESMDLVHYLDANYGQPILPPAAATSPIQTWQAAAWGPILRLAIPRLATADLPEFATPEARAAFVQRQTGNFGDFAELLAKTTELIQAVDSQLQELAPLLEQRTQVDLDDFTLYPTLRMLSSVKGINYPLQVKNYMQRMEQATKVPLHFAQAS